MNGTPANPLRWSDLDPDPIKELILRAVAEDGEGIGLRAPLSHFSDPSTDLVEDSKSSTRARLVSRETMVIAGLPIVTLVLAVVAEKRGLAKDSFHVEFAREDGEQVSPGETLAVIHGPAKLLLSAERTLLNFVQHLSGVATQTKRYVDAMDGSRSRLLDTRKTTPGYRFLEKYAVGCGGGYNHRLGLFDRIMLKDNHLCAGDFAQGEALTRAVEKARTAFPYLPVQVEVDDLSQIPPVLAARADYLMLDNFSDEDTRAALEMVDGKIPVELSGGITLESLTRKATLGADYLSTGALVHQSTWPDIGLDWD